MTTLKTDAVRLWLNALETTLDLAFHRGPEMPAFMKADNVGMVTKVPGGELASEGATEVVSLLVVVRSREMEYDRLEETMDQIDTALTEITSGPLWGVHVVSVARSGSISPVDEGPDHVSWLANYNVEIGK
jgi:hypothetical protein